MSKTVMVVDDSSSLRQVVTLGLRSAGYEVIEACDGKDALEKLDGRKINLIISDLNMPNMDGLQLLNAIKKTANYKFTPIILLTTEMQEERKAQAKQAGAKAWLVKPFVLEELLDTISKVIAA